MSQKDKYTNIKSVIIIFCFAFVFFFFNFEYDTLSSLLIICVSINVYISHLCRASQTFVTPIWLEQPVAIRNPKVCGMLS